MSERDDEATEYAAQLGELVRKVPAEAPQEELQVLLQRTRHQIMIRELLELGFARTFAVLLEALSAAMRAYHHLRTPDPSRRDF